MYESCTCKRIERLIKMIVYIHKFPYCSFGAVMQDIKISEATFFRFLHVAKELKVEIDFVKYKEKAGYKILNYGILNKNKL